MNIHREVDLSKSVICHPLGLVKTLLVYKFLRFSQKKGDSDFYHKKGRVGKIGVLL